MKNLKRKMYDLPNHWGREGITYRWMGAGERFLDVGAGSGVLCEFMKEKYKEVYGCDISDEAVKNLKDKGINAFKIDLNNEDFPFEDGYFDAVSHLGVIEHVINPPMLVNKIHRILRKGGVFIISTPNIAYIKHRIRAIIGKSPSTSDDTTIYKGGHLHYFTFSEMRELLEKAGFKVVGCKGTFSRGVLPENFPLKNLLAAEINFKLIKK